MTCTHCLLYLKWITNKVLLYSTGSSAQCYVAAWRGGEFKEEWIPVYVWLCLCCPPETTTVLLISYIPIQDKKFKKKKKDQRQLHKQKKKENTKIRKYK